MFCRYWRCSHWFFAGTVFLAYQTLAGFLQLLALLSLVFCWQGILTYWTLTGFLQVQAPLSLVFCWYCILVCYTLKLLARPSLVPPTVPHWSFDLFSAALTGFSLAGFPTYWVVNVFARWVLGVSGLPLSAFISPRWYLVDLLRLTLAVL